MVWAGNLNEFKLRLNAHFPISILLYDQVATLDSRKELGAGSLHAGAVESCSQDLLLATGLLYHHQFNMCLCTPSALCHHYNIIFLKSCNIRDYSHLFNCNQLTNELYALYIIHCQNVIPLQTPLK